MMKPWKHLRPRKSGRGALKGRSLASPLEKRPRLVGAGVAWSMGGDACVAPIGIKLSEEKRRKEDNKGLHMPS